MENSESKDENAVRKISVIDYFAKEPCIYSHRVFKNAGALYQALRHEDDSDDAYYSRRAQNLNGGIEPQKPTGEIPPLDFDDDEERRLTFELAFDALKYQHLLEEMLYETAFFSQFPEFREEEGITTVMLYDFQKRKFQHRVPLDREEVDPILKEIEKSIMSFRTKLNASLARNRIKANARSVDHLLPESLRAKEELKNTALVYAWVNQLKTTVTAVKDDLRQEGFQFLVNSGDPFEGKCFRMDDHCTDTIVFPPDQLEFLKTHLLFERHELIIQDKSSCLAPHVLMSVFPEGTDIMHINIGSGLVCAHLASLTKDSETTVMGFGVRDDDHQQRILNRLEQCGADKCVKIMTEEFQEVDPDDVKFKGVRSILLTAECSKTGVFNPIEFILTEGEDMSILKDLSTGEYDITKFGGLISKHSLYLKQCMKFTKARNIVYMTRSIKDAENDKIIAKGMEFSNLMTQTKRVAAFKIQRPLLPIVKPNNLGEVPDIDEQQDTALKLPGYSHNHRYIKFDASSENTGCFVALMTRDGEDGKESAKDVLARAMARGLLGPPKGKDRKHHRTKQERAVKKEDHEEHKAISDSYLEKPTRKKSEGSRTKLVKGKNRRPPWPKKATSSLMSTRTNKSPPGAPMKLSSSLSKNNKKVVPLHTASLGVDNGLLVGEVKPKVPEYQRVVHHPGPFRG